MGEALQKIELERFSAILRAVWGPAPDGKYRHWETIRRLTPPDGFTAEEYWFGQKFARLQLCKPVPGFLGKEGREFLFSLPEPVLEMLHNIDKRCAGHVEMLNAVTNPDVTKRYVFNSIMEEAISSSQLEGAATTRNVAKEMIRTGRKPASKGELMIFNNYRAMNFIRSNKEQDFSITLIETIHDILTQGIETNEPRYRQPGDGTGVYDNATNKLLYSPPDSTETEARLAALIAFANREKVGTFIPPTVKAIILHFWFAYIHPFSDGNGRTARALFYWYMLKKDYWFSEYVSISAILRKAPAKYGMSFLYTESDDNDLTYFILSQLRVFLRAIDGLEAYLERKKQENDRLAHLLRPGTGFNHRQIALLTHALRHPGTTYTVRSHETSHAIAKQTARDDLAGLVKAKLLNIDPIGKTHVYKVPLDIAKRLPQMLG